METSPSIPRWLIAVSLGAAVFYILWEINQFIAIPSDENTFWYTYNEGFLKLFSESDTFPQWNPYVFSGLSLHDTTPFPLSLSSLFTLLLQDGVLGLLLSRILLLAIGTLFLLAWLRDFGIKPILALPVLFLFFEYHVKNQSFESLPTLTAIVLTYLSLLYARKRKFYPIVLASLFLAIVLNDYTSQGTVFVFPFQILLLFFLRHQVDWRPHLYSILMIWTFGLLMAVPTLLPQIIDVKDSQKILCPDYATATLSSHYIRDILWYLHNAYGFTMSAGMVLPLTFALGMLFVYWKRFDNFTRAFIKTLYFFILLIAVFYFSQGFLNSIPGIGDFSSAYAKMRPVQVAHFGVLLLFGIAMERFSRKEIRPKAAGLLLFTAVFILLFFAQNVRLFFMEAHPTFNLVQILQIAMGILTLVLLTTNKRLFQTASAAGIFFIFILLWIQTGSRYYTGWFPYQFGRFPTIQKTENTIFRWDSPETQLKLTEFLRKEIRKDFSETAELRGYSLGDDMVQRYPSSQIPTILGFASIRPLRSHRFFLWLVDDLRTTHPERFNAVYLRGGFAYDNGSRYDTKLLNLMGVKYLIAHKKIYDKRFDIVMEGESTRIFKNRNAFPRVFLVNNALLLDSVEAVGETLRNASSETLRKTAVFLREDVEKTKGGAAVLESLSGGKKRGDAKIIKFSPNEVWVEVESEKSSLLILTQSYHRGWKVSVNDEAPSPIYPADYAFLGTMVPKGKSLVKFTFSDPFFVKGVYLASASLGVLLMILIVQLTMSRRLPKAPVGGRNNESPVYKSAG